MAQMASANNVKIQQGTFVGTGNNIQTIECPFEPDIILADCPAALSTNIGTGVASLVSAKSFGANSLDWIDDSATTLNMAAGTAYYSTAWPLIWSYSNNQMTFGRNNRYPRYAFISGATYNYTFIKYTT